MANGTQVLVGMGRPRHFPREIMRELYDENITFGAGGNCLTNAMLREKIGIKMNLRREADPCRPPETERVLTAKTISNYTREFFPESSNAPSTQAVRREEARFDPYNAVAFAATLQAILGDIDGEIIPYDLIFNSDQTSLKIGEDPVTKVFMVKICLKIVFHLSQPQIVLMSCVFHHSTILNLSCCGYSLHDGFNGYVRLE